MEISNQAKTYRSLGTISYSCQYHVLFCTKWRRKVLHDEVIGHLKSLVEEKQAEFGYILNSIDIAPDHVHLMLEIPPNQSVCTVISKIKGYTSNVLRSNYKELRSRIPTLWTRYYMASSVGNIQLSDLEEFLAAQNKN